MKPESSLSLPILPLSYLSYLFLCRGNDCPGKPGHVPFGSIIHNDVHVCIVDLYRLRYLAEHGVIAVRTCDRHLKRLHFTSVLLHAVSPQRWLVHFSRCQVLDVFAPTCVSVAAGLAFVYVLPCAFFVGLAVDSVGYPFCCAVPFSTSWTNETVVSPAVIFSEWIRSL